MHFRQLAFKSVFLVAIGFCAASGAPACSSGTDPEQGGTSSSGASSGGASSGGASSSGCAAGPGLCVENGACTEDPQSFSGNATYYDFADGSGNCSFDPTPNDLMIGAMNQLDYANSAVCGACAHVLGPKGEIHIRIVDQCPGCPDNHIDLSPEAFSKIADMSAGIVPITWNYEACAISGPIVYHWKEGSNPFWTAVQIRNHRYAIASVEYKGSDGNYHAMNRESYNYFIEPSGLGEGPYTMRVTDIYGQVLDDTGIAFIEAGDSPGQGQFPICTGKP